MIRPCPVSEISRLPVGSNLRARGSSSLTDSADPGLNGSVDSEGPPTPANVVTAPVESIRNTRLAPVVASATIIEPSDGWTAIAFEPWPIPLATVRICPTGKGVPRTATGAAETLIARSTPSIGFKV